MSENTSKEAPKQGNKMQVNSSASLSAFTTTSRAAFTLGAVILLSDFSLACSVQAQTPVRAHKKAHAHSDSSSLTVVGLLAGGAALMAGGGHGGSGSPSDASTPKSPFLQPQVVVTGSLPYATSVNDGGPGSVNDVPEVASFTAATAGNGTASAVLVTQRIAPTVAATFAPTVATTEAPAPLSLVSLVQTDFAAPAQETTLIDSAPSLPPAPSVPEPSASLTLAVGSLSLAALVMRGRRLRS